MLAKYQSADREAERKGELETQRGNDGLPVNEGMVWKEALKEDRKKRLQHMYLI